MIRIISFDMYRDMYRIVTPVYRFTPKNKQVNNQMNSMCIPGNAKNH